MTFNKRVDRLESGPNNPKSPNDEVIWVDTDNNTINRYNESNSSWVSVGGSGGGSSDTGDFRFINNSITNIDPSSVDQRITYFPEDVLSISNRNSSSQGSSIGLSKELLNINSSGSISVTSDFVSFKNSQDSEQIRFQNGGILFDLGDHLNNGNDIPALRLSSFPGMGTGNLESEFVSQGNLLIFSRDEMILNSLEGVYIGSISSNNQIATIGDILSASSGSLFSGDIQVDGQINLLTPASAAYITGYYDSMFGGNVLSIRSDYNVSIVGQSESEAGILNLAPLQASLVATGEDAVAEIRSYGVVKLSGENGVYVGEYPLTPDKEVATIGDLPSGATGSFTSQDNKTITVTNGIITSIV